MTEFVIVIFFFLNNTPKAQWVKFGPIS